MKITFEMVSVERDSNDTFKNDVYMERCRLSIDEMMPSNLKKNTKYHYTFPDRTCREDIVYDVNHVVYYLKINKTVKIIKVTLSPNDTDRHAIGNVNEMQYFVNNLLLLSNNRYTLRSNVNGLLEIDLLLSLCYDNSNDTLSMIVSYINLVMRDFTPIEYLTSKNRNRRSVLLHILKNLDMFNYVHPGYNSYILNSPIDMLLATNTMVSGGKSLGGIDGTNGPSRKSIPASIKSEINLYKNYGDIISRYLTKVPNSLNMGFWIAKYLAEHTEGYDNREIVYKIAWNEEFFRGKKFSDGDEISSLFTARGKVYMTIEGAKRVLDKLNSVFNYEQFSIVDYKLDVGKR